MGNPKRQRKKYQRPKKPWDKVRIEEEKRLMKEFGLRRKREIWRAEAIVKKIRRRARELQATKNKEEIKILLEKVQKLGLVGNDADLDDILGLEERHLLERRLQTFVKRLEFANTMKHARQLIVHGHVLVNGRKIQWPSFIVTRELEDRITLDNKTASKIKGGSSETN